MTGKLTQFQSFVCRQHISRLKLVPVIFTSGVKLKKTNKTMVIIKAGDIADNFKVDHFGMRWNWRLKPWMCRQQICNNCVMLCRYGPKSKMFPASLWICATKNEGTSEGKRGSTQYLIKCLLNVAYSIRKKKSFALDNCHQTSLSSNLIHLKLAQMYLDIV